jgi:hypothetical protein
VTVIRFRRGRLTHYAPQSQPKTPCDKPIADVTIVDGEPTCRTCHASWRQDL